MTAPDPRLGEIAGRLEAATPGPWETYDANEGEWPPRPMWCVANDAFHNPPANDDETYLAVEIHTGVMEDASFIANAPADVAYLLAELRKRDEALGRVDGVLERLEVEVTNSRAGEAAAAEANYGAGLMGHQAATYAYRLAAQLIRAAVAAATGGDDAHN